MHYYVGVILNASLMLFKIKIYVKDYRRALLGFVPSSLVFCPLRSNAKGFGAHIMQKKAFGNKL